MRPVKIVCDRCGAEITGNPFQVLIDETDRETGSFLYSDPFEIRRLDFCDKCISEIAKMILAKESENTERTEELEQKAERKRIDRGKLMALHNAGWKASKIADEMGISEGAVHNTVSKIKKEQT